MTNTKTKPRISSSTNYAILIVNDLIQGVKYSTHLVTKHKLSKDGIAYLVDLDEQTAGLNKFSEFNREFEIIEIELDDGKYAKRDEYPPLSSKRKIKRKKMKRKKFKRRMRS